MRNWNKQTQSDALFMKSNETQPRFNGAGSLGSSLIQGKTVRKQRASSSVNMRTNGLSITLIIKGVGISLIELSDVWDR